MYQLGIIRVKIPYIKSNVSYDFAIMNNGHKLPGAYHPRTVSFYNFLIYVTGGAYLI